MPVDLSPPRQKKNTQKKKDPKHDDPRLRKADMVPPPKQARHIPLLRSFFFFFFSSPAPCWVKSSPCWLFREPRPVSIHTRVTTDGKSRQPYLVWLRKSVRAHMCDPTLPAHFGNSTLRSTKQPSMHDSCAAPIDDAIGLFGRRQAPSPPIVISMTASHLHLRNALYVFQFCLSISARGTPDRKRAKIG